MTTATRSTSPGHLLRVLGVGFGIAVTVGNTIGAGIFRSAGVVGEQLPTAVLFIGIWIIAGAFTLIAAPSFAELGTMIPRSGGHYVFSRAALGEYPAFVIGWTDWLSTMGSGSAVSLVIAEYLGLLIPPLAPFRIWIACSVIIIFALLQWRGIKTGSNVQNISSALKALGLLALVAACFIYSGRAPETRPAPELAQGYLLFTAVVLAIQAAIYTYDGWTGIIYFSEETTDPARDVPRSMFGGTISVMALYLLLSAATLKVVPMSEIAGSPLAIGVAARTIFGDYGDTLIQVLLVIAMLSAINAYHLMGCRVVYSMGVDGLAPRKAANVNVGGTPDFALLLSTIAAIMFIIGGRVFETVIAITAFFFTLQYIVGFICLIVLRKREPDRPRPYRAWGYPWTTGIAMLGYSAFIIAAVYTDWQTSRWSLLILVASYPLFKIIQHFRHRESR
jgi:basic amino acid/polyamine antiporter, APA family